MTEADEYRRRAVECEIAADGIRDPKARISLLELARNWLRLASYKERARPRVNAIDVGGGDAMPLPAELTHYTRN